ncbi:MAG: aspartate carbamoyltransferase [Deltaproteobacteria bacterium]|nr:aspartate carbamoyltransferase [Deltaproteobacteria bacterium]
MNFQGKDIISMNDLTREEIDHILAKVDQVRNLPEKGRLCAGKVCAMMFFEPSTRTRTSFEVAMRNLGGEVGGFYDRKITSAEKDESLWDTVKMHDGYGFNVIVIRHPLKGAARLAAEAAEIPVINAGDGPNQHPTQTLLDLYSLQETQGRIDGLTIAMVGDLANGRTVHSMTEALLKYTDCRMIFISPRDLAMPRFLIDKCRKVGAQRNITVEEGSRIEDYISEVDVLYMTRIQVERLEERMAVVEKLRSIYRLEAGMLRNARPTMKVMHPLPRVTEIAPDVDATPHAYYFEQARNGLFVRETLLALILGAVQ